MAFDSLSGSQSPTPKVGQISTQNQGVSFIPPSGIAKGVRGVDRPGCHALRGCQSTPTDG